MTVNALIESFRATRPHCGADPILSTPLATVCTIDYFADSLFDDFYVSHCVSIRTRATRDSLCISNFLLNDFYKLN